MQNKLEKEGENHLAWWETIWCGEGRGGIRDKQTNLDKGSSGGSAGEQRGLRCLRGGLPSTDPELRLRCCLAALSSGCQHALIYQGGHASRHLALPCALPL